MLYKIIIRLTQQSDDALLANLELIQEKEALKQYYLIYLGRFSSLVGSWMRLKESWLARFKNSEKCVVQLRASS